MDEEPGIVRFTPRSTSKSAMLIAVGVALCVQVALCAVLVAIHFQELWLPSVQSGEVEMEFVAPSEEILQELEEVRSVPVDPAAAPPTVSSIPEITADEDLLAMKLPENEDCSEMKDCAGRARQHADFHERGETQAPRKNSCGISVGTSGAG